MNVSDFIQFDHNDDERIMMRMMNPMMMVVVMTVKVHQGELSENYKFTIKRVLN